jgi:DNA repair exonuclease SbcCD ATPase subunit
VRITRLQVRNVRRHQDLDLRLDGGLTVIRGPNESGKTTIQRALELALTRKVTSSSNDLDAMRPWGARDDDRPWVRLEFEQDEGDVVRTGAVEKAFRGAKGTVRFELDGTVTTDPAEADAALADLSGIPTEAFFRSTASVRHHELDDMVRDEAALRDRLQSSISGGDVGTSFGKKKLQRAIFELRTQGAKNPGRIKIAEAAIAQSGAALRNGEELLERLERDRDALTTAHDARVRAEAILAERRSLLEKARMAERLTAERDAAKERFIRLSDSVRVAAKIAELEATHPAKVPIWTLRDVVKRIGESDIRIRELRARLAGQKPVTEEHDDRGPLSWRAVLVTALATILAAVFTAYVALSGSSTLPAYPITIGDGEPFSIYLPVAGFLGLLALVELGLVVRWRSAASRHAETVRQRTIEREKRQGEREALEAELGAAQTMVAELLMRIDVPPEAGVSGATALLEREEAHAGEIARLNAQLEGLGVRAEQNAEKERDGAALDAERKAAALAELGPIAQDPRARERLEAEVAAADRELDAARDAEAQARARVDQNPADAEEIAGHAERLAAWREQLALLERRARVYELALDAIERAERATLQTATRYLEQRMVGDLARVTAGRYRRVQVDDADLAIRVWAPERGDWVDVSALSQGTLDLVYLAARIGLVRLVTGDRRPPLVLDDPFVTLDDARAERALALLKEISRDFQVIYLTTSDRYDATAGAVCVLPGPSALTPESLLPPSAS